MGLGDLGENKKEESKEERAEEAGIDKGEIEDFEELKDRVQQQTKTIHGMEKRVEELENDIESLTAMIEGIFTLMRDGGELVEVTIKDKEEEDNSDDENPWGVG